MPPISQSSELVPPSVAVAASTVAASASTAAQSLFRIGFAGTSTSTSWSVASVPEPLRPSSSQVGLVAGLPVQ